MGNKFDTIIVGAGIAGLLTAMRLSQKGQRVLIVEKDKIGSGSTISNHGMVHSGALFIRQHGHIVNNCKEAQGLFLNLLTKAEIPTRDSIYISKKSYNVDLTKLLEQNDFDYKSISINEIQEVKPEIAKKYKFISLKERVFSSSKILLILTSYCLANKVEFLLGTKVSKIIKKSKRVKGVIVGGSLFLSNNVVVATGLGTTQLLQTFNSYYCQFLKSRLDMMVYLPGASLSRGFVFVELDKPILMPANPSGSLGSYFGGIQPQIRGERKFPVDFDKARLLIEMINLYFNSKIVKTHGAQFFMCGKTDYIGDKYTEKGFINPGFYIIDHRKFDEIEGLYTVITGKMTLAFHASKTVADMILRTDLDLQINQSTRIPVQTNTIAVEPWASLYKE